MKFQCVECDKRFSIPKHVVEKYGAGSRCPKCKGDSVVLPPGRVDTVEAARIKSSNYKKTDNRKVKMYKASAVYTVNLPEDFKADRMLEHKCGVYPYPKSLAVTVQDALTKYLNSNPAETVIQRLVPTECLSATVTVGSKFHQTYHQGAPHVAIRFTKYEVRPKHICTQEQMDDLVSALFPEGLNGFVMKALTDCETAQRKALDLMHIYRDVNLLGKALSKEAENEARKISRYNQRLAALTAELDAERDVQLKTLLTQVSTVAQQYHPKAVEIIPKFVDKFTNCRTVPSPRRLGRMFRISDYEISHEDVAKALEE